MKSPFVLAIAGLAVFVGSNAVAEPVAVHVSLTPQEQMKFEFADGSKHFVLAVRREGKAEVPERLLVQRSQSSGGTTFTLPFQATHTVICN